MRVFVPDYLCTSIVVLWNLLTEHSSLSYLVDYLLNYLCNGFICGSVLIYSLIFTYPSTNFYFCRCHIPYEIPTNMNWLSIAVCCWMHTCDCGLHRRRQHQGMTCFQFYSLYYCWMAVRHRLALRLTHFSVRR